MAGRRVKLDLPRRGVDTSASPTEQPRFTTRLGRNARPRDWVSSGIRRAAQRPGVSKFSDEATGTGSVQAIIAARPSIIGASVTASPTWTDLLNRATSSGSLGDFTGDATADYDTDGTGVVAVGSAMTTAAGATAYNNFNWAAVYAAGSAARCRTAAGTYGYLEDNVNVSTSAGPSGQLSAVYFKPTSGGTLPTDNFYIKFTVTVADCVSANTESAVGFFVGGKSSTVAGSAVDSAFTVLIQKTRAVGNGPYAARCFNNTGAIGSKTWDDARLLTGNALPTIPETGGGQPDPVMTNRALLENWTNGSKKTIELRKNGKRVEIRVGNNYADTADTELCLTFPNIALRPDDGTATPYISTQTEFGIVLFNVASSGSPAFSKIENIQVGTCSLNSMQPPTRVVVVCDGDVSAGGRDGFSAASSGTDVVLTDAEVNLIEGLGATAASGKSYVYLLDGTAYRKVEVGESLATVSTWAASAGTLPAGASDATRLARYGLRWQGSIWLYGVDVNPDNAYGSRRGSPDDWSYTSATDPANRAVAFSTSGCGLFPVAIRCMAPLSADRMIVAGNTAMAALVGHPNLGGQFFAITGQSGVGIVGPHASASDPEGNFYFCFYDGIYRIPRGTLLANNISGPRMDRVFDGIDYTAVTIRLSWSRYMDGLHVFVCPNDGTAGTHLFWDRGEDAWYTDTLPENVGPAAIAVYTDETAMNDRGGDVVLVGGQDGYIRQFDTAAFDDDGVQIDSALDIGPMTGDGHGRLCIDMVEPVLGASNHRVIVDLIRADSAELLETATAAFSKTWMGTGNREPWMIESAAGAQCLRIRSAGKGRYWSIDSINAQLSACSDIAGIRRVTV